MTSTIEINHQLHRSNFEEKTYNEVVVNTDPSISYSEFFENFLVKNKPCIFRSDITESWLSRRDWSTNNGPNFVWLKEYFGDCKVPIADCNKKFYNAQCKEDMSMREYIDYWIDYQKCNYSNNMPSLYLKDWHCVKSYSNKSFYDVPKFLASDWLNEYYIAHQDLDDDYMFVYMGPKGTWTPFHVDVFTSYSWSANIVGKKRWLLFPPGEENYLKNDNGELIYDVTSEEFSNSTNNNETYNKPTKSIEIIQEAGQIIFVPSGWHHQVWNLEDTISINHNWFNGCNIWNVWNSLKNEMSAVMKEIEDCRDMDDWEMHCQIMLKASFGINYLQFYELLSFIAEKRLDSVIHKVPIKTFNKWCLGKHHCLFDLQQIKNVVESLINDVNDKKIDSILWRENEAQVLVNKINAISNNNN